METEEKVERGSGNVFADLGYPESEVHLLKAEFVTCIDRIIRYQKLKQVDVAKLFGLPQSEVSRLLRGNFHDYPVERLLRLLARLGRNVNAI